MKFNDGLLTMALQAKIGISDLLNREIVIVMEVVGVVSAVEVPEPYKAPTMMLFASTAAIGAAIWPVEKLICIPSKFCAVQSIPVVVNVQGRVVLAPIAATFVMGMPLCRVVRTPWTVRLAPDANRVPLSQRGES